MLISNVGPDVASGGYLSEEIFEAGTTESSKTTAFLGTMGINNQVIPIDLGSNVNVGTTTVFYGILSDNDDPSGSNNFVTVTIIISALVKAPIMTQ